MHDRREGSEHGNRAKYNQESNSDGATQPSSSIGGLVYSIRGIAHGLHKHLHLRLFFGASAIPLILLFASLALLSSLLLIAARTLDGRLFAFGALSLSVLAIHLAICVLKLRKPKRWWPPAILFVAGALALLVCVARAPSGKLPRGNRLQSIYRGSRAPSRLSPSMLVPEADQLRLGSYMMPMFDPILDFRQASRIRAIYDRLYGEIRKSEEYIHIGSVLGDAYSDMLLGRRKLDHYYIYYPDILERRPVLIFLHGWLGNFKSYVWLWSEFADRNGFVVICPSFGGGGWNRPAAEAKLREIVDLCTRDPRIDPKQLYIAGLSNGGIGVTRAALMYPEVFRSLIYISPVLEENVVGGDDFRDALGDTPILIVHGGKDRRLPKDYVTTRVEKMQASGLNVRRKCFENEDHVLIFSSFDRLAADIEEWMRESIEQPGPQ